MKALYRRLGSLSSVYALGSGAQKAVSILLLPLYTRYLTLADFGVLALMSVTISIIATTVVMPITCGLVRYYYRPEHKEEQSPLLTGMFVLLLAKTAIAAGGYALLWRQLGGLLFDDANLLGIVRLYALILFVTPISSFLQSFLKLKERAKLYVVSSLLSFILSTALIIYLIVAREMGVAGVVYGQFLGLSLMCVVSLPELLRSVGSRFSPSLIRRALAYGYPQIVSGHANLLIQMADRYVLQILGSLNAVGVYSFGYRIASVLDVLMVQPTKQALRPVILQSEDDPKLQKRLLSNAATHFYLVGILVALVLSLFARDVIVLLSDKQEFWSSWVVVPILAFVYIQHGLGNFLGWGNVMMDRTYRIAGAALVSATVNIGLNLLLIPRFGILGAAWATLASYMAWNALKAIDSARFYELHFQWRRLLLISGTGIGLFLISLWFGQAASIQGIALKAMLLPAYFIILLAVGFFSSKEKAFMHRIIASLRTRGFRETCLRLGST